MALIKKCVCGSDKGFDRLFKNKIRLLKCRRCEILHQEVRMSEEEYNSFYSTDYHADYQTEIGCAPYEIRYRHDCGIAEMRLAKYAKYKIGGALLDIGSGNGAFVDTAREKGWDAWGIEPGVTLAASSKHVFNTCLRPDCLPSWCSGRFDLITLHDVFEHLVDPFSGLDVMEGYLHPHGILVIDFPDYFEEAGRHHWREIQHLWYFTREQVETMLDSRGFKVLDVDRPIAGKFVFYAERKISSRPH
jgi:hypothetical protein